MIYLLQRKKGCFNNKKYNDDDKVISKKKVFDKYGPRSQTYTLFQQQPRVGNV